MALFVCFGFVSVCLDVSVLLIVIRVVCGVGWAIRCFGCWVGLVGLVSWVWVLYGVSLFCCWFCICFCLLVGWVSVGCFGVWVGF